MKRGDIISMMRQAMRVCGAGGLASQARCRRGTALQESSGRPGEPKHDTQTETTKVEDAQASRRYSRATRAKPRREREKRVPGGCGICRYLRNRTSLERRRQSASRRHSDENGCTAHVSDGECLAAPQRDTRRERTGECATGSTATATSHESRAVWARTGAHARSSKNNEASRRRARVSSPGRARDLCRSSSQSQDTRGS